MGVAELGEPVNTTEKWARDLTDVIRLWCGDNGYNPMNTLGRELGIPDKTWSTLMQGKSVVSDVTVYARLFVKTGRPEADPRKIPPRKWYVPGSAGWMDKPRAWTEKEWQGWKQSLSPTGESEEPKAPSQEAVKVLSPPGKTHQEPADSTILNMLLDLVAEKVAARLEDRLADIAKIFDETLQTQKSVPAPRSDGDLTRQLTTLLQILRAAASGTKEEKDAITRKYRKLMGDLFPLIEAFTFDPEERDKYLASVRTISL